MTPKPIATADRSAFQQLAEVRAAAIEHTRAARQLSRERRVIIDELIGRGYSQSDIARELGVTRQAIQKMLAAG